MPITLIEPIEGEFIEETNALVSEAETFTIQNDAQYLGAAEFLLGVKDLVKRIKDTFADPKQKAHEAHKAIVKAEKRELEPVERAESIVKRKMVEWERAERLRIEAERRELEAEARKREEERRLAAAIAAEESGRHDVAEAILDRPAPTPVVKMPEPAKIEGIGYRTTYSATVTDKAGFIRWVAENPEERGHFLLVNQSAIDSRAREMRQSFNLPGCQLQERRGIAARRG